MAKQKVHGDKVSSIIFDFRTITLFKNGYVTVSTLGSLGNRLGGFIKGIEKLSNTSDKEVLKKGLADAKAELKNPTSLEPRKLISIELDTQNVTKKTGVGRGVAAVITTGFSLAAAPSNRGDIYLTIVTEEEVFALHQTLPRDNEIKELKKFVTTAKALI